MVKNLCVSIPIELRKYQKVSENKDIILKNSTLPFGVKIIRNALGEVEHSAHYSDNGELLKKVFYKGSSVVSISHYRNQCLSAKEEFIDNKITNKRIYDKEGNIISTTRYCYNRKDKIVSIKKICGDDIYFVEYGYDELERVNSRKISCNTKVIREQTYRYDILDRIVEYKDENQTIKIMRISSKNELISYTITDKIGNNIYITNNIDICGNYDNTEISLNGHKIKVKDKSYVDNIMLKKPYTTEDDLDFVIANLLAEPPKITNRENINEITDKIISGKVEAIQAKTLPISIRKRLLYSI